MKALCTSLFLCVITISATAQLPLIDISAVDDGNGAIEVLVRADGPFDEVFSSLVFTIRWNTADGATLGNVTQSVPEILYMPIAKSGTETDDSGYRYQIFAGFGGQQMATFGASFVGGMETSLMTIPVNGSSTFEIVNDAWTGVITNNADYYVSLNGQDRTGIIYGGAISTGVDDSFQSIGATVVPNPATDQVQLQLENPSGESLFVELVNSIGQIIWEDAIVGNADVVNRNVDMRKYEGGSYYFRLIGDTGVRTVPFILK